MEVVVMVVMAVIVLIIVYFVYNYFKKNATTANFEESEDNHTYDNPLEEYKGIPFEIKDAKVINISGKDAGKIVKIDSNQAVLIMDSIKRMLNFQLSGILNNTRIEIYDENDNLHIEIVRDGANLYVNGKTVENVFKNNSNKTKLLNIKLKDRDLLVENSAIFTFDSGYVTKIIVIDDSKIRDVLFTTIKDIDDDLTDGEYTPFHSAFHT